MANFCVADINPFFRSISTPGNGSSPSFRFRIVHLAALCNVDVEDPIAQLGLTDAVRWIFARDKKPLNVDAIVEALEESYRDVSGYKNLPANIHTILRRLAKSNEIKPEAESGGVLGKIGGVKYVWNGGLGPPPPPQSWLKERLKKS